MNSIKKILALSLCVVMFAALFCGCELKEDVVINKDGTCKMTTTTIIPVEELEIAEGVDTTVNGQDIATLPKKVINGKECYVDKQTKSFKSIAALKKELTAQTEESSGLFKKVVVTDKKFEGYLIEGTEMFADMGMSVQFGITLPYKIAKTNGKLSKDKKTVTFNINGSKTKIYAYTSSALSAKKDISKTKISLSCYSYTYNGKVKTHIVTVKTAAGTKLKKNVDYTLKSSSGRKNVGTYTVTVTGKGNYTGTKKLTFKILPTKTGVSKLTAGKESVTVNISKKSTQVTGYQVQYSTSKKFTSAKTKTISSYKTTKYTLKSLSAKKTYYVRVRTYKTVNGKKYYSGWSTAKSAKTK